MRIKLQHSDHTRSTMTRVDLVQSNYYENKSHCLPWHGMEAEYVGMRCVYVTTIYYQPHERPLMVLFPPQPSDSGMVAGRFKTRQSVIE